MTSQLLEAALGFYFRDRERPPFDMEQLLTEVRELVENEERASIAMADHFFVTLVPPVVRNQDPTLEGKICPLTEALFRSVFVQARTDPVYDHFTVAEKLYLTQSATLTESEDLLVRYKYATLIQRTGMIADIIATRRRQEPWTSIQQIN